jgi:hypothetical protein
VVKNIGGIGIKEYVRGFNETKRSTDRESHDNPPGATGSGVLAEQKRLPDGTKRINSSNCISDLQKRMKIWRNFKLPFVITTTI